MSFESKGWIGPISPSIRWIIWKIQNERWNRQSRKYKYFSAEYIPMFDGYAVAGLMEN